MTSTVPPDSFKPWDPIDLQGNFMNKFCILLAVIFVEVLCISYQNGYLLITIDYFSFLLSN